MKKFLCLCLVLVLFCSLTACDRSDEYKLEITSDSMAPTFTTGDTIIYKTVDPDTLKEGDIIAFWMVADGQRFVCVHRIVTIYTDGDSLFFETKGDNNTASDVQAVHETNVLGIYVRKAFFGLF